MMSESEFLKDPTNYYGDDAHKLAEELEMELKSVDPENEHAHEERHKFADMDFALYRGEWVLVLRALRAYKPADAVGSHHKSPFR